MKTEKNMTAKPQIKARIIRAEHTLLDKVAEIAKMEHQSSNGFIIKAIEERLKKLEKQKA